MNSYITRAENSDNSTESNNDDEYRKDSDMHDQNDLHAAIDFMKLLAASSLGTEEARNDRLVGRCEISRLQEESPDFARRIEPADQLSFNEFDLTLADELQHRDRTFEAELRYHAITSSLIVALNDESVLDKSDIRRAALALAQLLDAKGFSEESLRLYARATQADDANATWRLAVIWRQAGQTAYAQDFAQLAGSMMSADHRNAMRKTMQQICKYKHDPDVGRILEDRKFGDGSEDVAYAVGSALLISSGRADLASLAYCSALSRGHSLAAISLMDLPGLTNKQRGSANRALTAILETTEIQQKMESAKNDDLLRTTLTKGRTLSVDTSNDSLEKSIRNYQMHPRRQTYRLLTQRILLIARATTTLRGYVKIGHTIDARDTIRTINDQVCRELIKRIKHSRPTHISPILDTIWNISSVEIDHAVNERRQHVHAGIIEPDPRSGTVARYRRAFAGLPHEQGRTVLLLICGATENDVADSISPAEATTQDREDCLKSVRDAYAAGIRRLRYEQRGEQYDTQLWNDVASAIPPPLAKLFNDLFTQESITADS